MKTRYRHRDSRFTVTIVHSHSGGRRQVIATVHLDGWGVFYRATRSTPKKAMRAANNAIGKYSSSYNDLEAA